MQQIIVDFGLVELFGTQVPLRLYGYGLMLVIGFLLGIWLAQVRARRAGENPDAVAYCGVLALIGGVVGARVAYVAENWDAYRTASLGEMFNVTSGGLIYYGGVVLAGVLVIVYLRAKKLPVRRYLDIIAPSLMIGLALGRAGCTLNGCCYGAPADSDAPLAMHFPIYSQPLVKLDGRENPYSVSTPGSSPVYSHQVATGRVRPPEELVGPDGTLIPPAELTGEQVEIARHTHAAPVKPAQPVGMANAVILAGILVGFGRLRRREGQVFALLLILYPITRFLLESIRSHDPAAVLAGGLTHNQYTSLGLLAGGIVLMLALRKLPASAGPTWAERIEQAGSSARRSAKARRARKA